MASKKIVFEFITRTPRGLDSSGEDDGKKRGPPLSERTLSLRSVGILPVIPIVAGKMPDVTPSFSSAHPLARWPDHSGKKLELIAPSLTLQAPEG